MKKIIVPIDFSKHSEYALKYAANFATKFNAEILALHMLELSNAVISRTDSAMHQEAIFFIKLAENKFETFLDKEYLSGLKVTPIVKHFKVFSEVNDVAIAHNADLVIMGSHGASGVKELFIGSNTEKVVRHSDIPVLVVKQESSKLDFNNVVFASDFSAKAVRPYLNACNLFKQLDLNMHMVYVNLPDDSFKSTPEIEKSLEDFFIKAEGHSDKMNSVKCVNDYTIENGILNFANVVGADLIAVATHGRKGIAHFFEGSISEDIANHSTLPVLTFKI
ncbi:MAG: universal stress protein [Winogradskyella sp.]|uniref:universal stress protein n=1 Tax=Winogradskyella sp. TaxID=1883156 RepID=UPI0017EEE1D6|nr:universal stress protein [Winogradskyella sp.]